MGHRDAQPTGGGRHGLAVRADELHEGFLRDVLGIGAIAEDAVRDSDQPGILLRKERFEA